MEPDAPGRRAPRAILLLGVAVVIIVALSLMVLPLGGDGDRGGLTVGGHPLFGKPAPEIDLQTFEGGRLTLSSLRGQPVIVNFWAAWCGPCRDEFPLMVQTYADRADEGLEILGLLHDDTVENGRAFAEEQGATWPMLDDAEGTAWEAYLGVGTPTSFFIDPDGVVQAFSLGPFSEDGLERQLATIIPEA